MRNIYAELSQLEYFIENDYLVKYCQLIESNKRTKQFSKETHKHHVLPRSWFKLTGKTVNDCLNNLVNLTCRYHILAHYYLCLCTEDPFRYANELGLFCLESDIKNDVDKHLLRNLPLYNNIYEDYMLKLKSNYKLYR